MFQFHHRDLPPNLPERRSLPRRSLPVPLRLQRSGLRQQGGASGGRSAHRQPRGLGGRVRAHWGAPRDDFRRRPLRVRRKIHARLRARRLVRQGSFKFQKHFFFIKF